MTISNMRDPNTMIDATVYGRDGTSLGKIGAIYFDNETDEPAWAAVKSGLFGAHVSLVPLAQGSWDGAALTVPFDMEALATAPHHDPGPALSPSDEEDLYRHYGTATGQTAADTPTSVDPRHDRTGEPGAQGRDISGPTIDDVMTRSEERMHTGIQQREAGRTAQVLRFRGRLDDGAGLPRGGRART